jgi:hypothetical protein
MCGVFNVFFWLSQMVCAVFGLCTLTGVGAGVQRWGLALLIWPNREGVFLPEDEDRIQSLKHCFLNKNRMMDNVQKHNSCRSNV